MPSPTSPGNLRSRAARNIAAATTKKRQRSPVEFGMELAPSMPHNPYVAANPPKISRTAMAFGMNTASGPRHNISNARKTFYRSIAAERGASLAFAPGPGSSTAHPDPTGFRKKIMKAAASKTKKASRTR